MNRANNLASAALFDLFLPYELDIMIIIPILQNESYI
jgi:hypothetical protein